MFFLGIALVTVITLVAAAFWWYPPLWRDLLTLRIICFLMRNVVKAFKAREFIIDRFEKHARTNPDSPMILFKDERYTYGQVDALACKFAGALLKEGVTTGDTVSLLMSNEPAYLWIYLGAQKIGARLALINHHLMSDGLLHCIDACQPSMLIVGDGLAGDYLPAKVAKLVPSLSNQVPVYSYNPPREGAKFPCMSQIMEELPSDPIDPAQRSEIKLTDPSIYIYTSGTTGLPKPAIITHRKSILCSLTYAPIGFTCKDVLYLALPLYHASAMNLSVVNVISEGASLVLRDKFSASRFWADCVHYNVTIVQYIGEMMRYLVNTPECPEEKQHKLWGMAGNGLRRDVWEKMNSRFKVPNIYEFYGSTEIPASLTNYFSIVGSVGRLSPLLSRMNDLVLVDMDHTTQRPYRDPFGRCRRTLPGGCGVLIARLSSKRTFDGYIGPASLTSSKILKDVFVEGDHYVSTNDLFYIDKHYNVYFKDRLGDAIRWKGENVSPTEVSNVLISADFIQDANVYGVPVPGHEGKTGMAAISLKTGEEVDEEKIEEIGKLSREKLPAFARPRFIRFQRQMSLTSTFKQNKLELAEEGFDVKKIDEPLYFLHRKDDTYQPLDEDAYNKIVDGYQAL